jgi:hypothetical protein
MSYFSMLRVASIVATALLMLAEGRASAEDKKGRVIVLKEVEIVGRIQKPIASVEASKLQPKLTLHELRQPLITGVEEAIKHDPF